jgi:hypothetical protein
MQDCRGLYRDGQGAEEVGKVLHFLTRQQGIRQRAAVACAGSMIPVLTAVSATAHRSMIGLASTR